MTAKLTAVQKMRNARVKRIAAFNLLSPSAKRVVIAQDLLAQLASKKLIPVHMKYLRKVDHSAFFNELEDQNVEIVDLIENVPCEGCALAGMFKCAVERADKLKVNKLTKMEENTKEDYLLPHKYMEKFFSRLQIDQIEVAFEGTCNGMQLESAWSSLESAKLFAPYDRATPKEIMMRIMLNIIANKGTFKPEQGWNAHKSVKGHSK